MRRTLVIACGVTALGMVAQAHAVPAAARGAAAGPHLTRTLHDLVGHEHNQLGVGPIGQTPVPLQYNGGLVEQAQSVSYAIFWEPTGSSVSPTYNSLISRWFQDAGSSTLYGQMTQYYQTVNGVRQNIVQRSSLGGTWVDSSAYPSSTLTDQDLQNEVARAMSANGWSGGVGREFFVYTARGENSCINASTCSFSTFCAYHNHFTLNGTDVLYADQPYTGTQLSGCGVPASPNGDIDADSTINVTSHEQFETITDSNLDAWSDPTGNENGDKCNFTFGPRASNGSDITVNGHPYLVQEEFSNRALGCSMS